MQGHEIVLIGHAGHPEVAGTMGQLPSGVVKLVESAAQAREFVPDDPRKLAYITQTTLSVDDTQEIVDILRERFPSILSPHKEDICYATTNRQLAVKTIAARCDRLIVVGAPNSSNSKRLVEVAQRAGCEQASLLQCAEDLDWRDYHDIRTIGITAGASAPEVLVDEIIAAFSERFETTIEAISTADENVSFKLPRELRESL
jgi:4-hydroxy-3-methylbut-2-enyl diphosphate reductase